MELKHIFTKFVQKKTNKDGTKLYFRRATARYAQKGSFSSNQGYLAVSRDTLTGRFTSAK